MKIKRIILIILAVFYIIGLFGCEMSSGNVTSIEKDPDTFLDTAIIKEFDIRDWNIIVHKGSETTYVQVNYQMISLEDVAKLNKVGEYDITFTYENKSFVHHIVITKPSDDEIRAELANAMSDDLIESTATSNIILPQTIGYVSLVWTSDSPYVEIKGYKAIITRPNQGNADHVAILHATFSAYDINLEKDYEVLIPAVGMDEIYHYLDDVVLAIQTPTSITNELNLLFNYSDVSVIWHSDNSVISINNDTKKVTVAQTMEDTSVKLTVDLIYKGSTYYSYATFDILVIPTSSIRIAPKVTNLSINKNTLSWDNIESINKYNIYVNGQLRTSVTTNSLLLTNIIMSAGTYSVGVQSVATGIYNTDSEIVTISYEGSDIVGYSGTYYNNTNLLSSGKTLKAELRSLVTTTHKSSRTYENLKTDIPKSDKSLTNPSKVVLIYSRVETQGAWSSGGVYWNREHVWPQSQGWFTTSGAGSDLHHLRPEDPSLNSSRGNKPFAEVGNGTQVKLSSANGGKYSGCYSTSSYFEPQDDAKGDVARIIFYLLVRYTEADSYNINKVAYSYDLLLSWNELDPVDEWEMSRNDVTEGIQGNRNPFIDYPNLAAQIWG